MAETKTQHPSPAFAQSQQACLLEEEIIRYISQFMPLSDDVAKAVAQNMKLKTFEKGAFLLKEGQVSNLRE